MLVVCVSSHYSNDSWFKVVDSCYSIENITSHIKVIDSVAFLFQKAFIIKENEEVSRDKAQQQSISTQENAAKQ